MGLILLVVVLIVPLIGVVVRSCTLPRGVPKHPACGRCGYAFTKWDICPECGGRAAHVGVVTPYLALRSRGSTAGAVFALALLMTLGGVTLWVGGVGLFLTIGYAHDMATVEYLPTAPVQPSAGKPYSIVASLDAERGPKGPFSGSILVSVDPTAAAMMRVPGSRYAVSSHIPYAEIDAATGHARVVDSSGKQAFESPQFELDAMHQLMALSGLNVADDDVQRVAFNAVLELATLRSNSGASIARATPPTSTAPSALRVSGTSTRSGMLVGMYRLPGLSAGQSWLATVAVVIGAPFLLLLRFVLRRRAILMAIGAQATG